jgi:hypothetical protein
MKTPSPAVTTNECEQAGKDVNVPAQEVDSREREVLCADHDRDQEVAERRRNRRDQEEEHHDHAVHREHAVVDVGAHQRAFRAQQLKPDQQREEPAEEEEGGD